MAGEDDETFDPTEADDDQLIIDESGEEAEQEAVEQLQAAAAQIEVVVLPLACTNEGKGAPIGMGIQRWLAQDLSKAGAKAAAPVFTALHEREDGRQVPALMIYRDEWTDERAGEGILRFPNAKRAVVPEIHVEEDRIKLGAILSDIAIEGEGDERAVKLTTIESWTFDTNAEGLPKELFELSKGVLTKLSHDYVPKTWDEAFGTKDHQAALSFLVGLGNLSALQGRTVPSSSDQLLNPLMDALNRDAEMDIAMEALHQMTDILITGQPDRSAIPLSVQALNIAAQRRQKDPDAWHHLALVARRLGDLQTAIQAFNQAFNLAPASMSVATNFIQTLRRAGDKDNALKVAQFAIENGNEAPAVLALVGSLLIEHDEFDQAEPFLRRAVNEGKIPSAFGDLANVLWDRGDENDADDEDRKEAMNLLATAVDQTHIARSTLDMLLDLYEDEELAEAGALLDKAVTKHGENAVVLTAAANMHVDGDEPEKARPHLEAILGLKRRSLDDDAFARRGLLTLDIDGFEDRYDAAVEDIQSGDPSKTADAAKFMREIIEKDKLFWQPHLMLALAVRETEGDTAALGHLMSAVRLRPNDAEIRDLIAAILRKQGRPREAVEHLRVVVSLRPRDVTPVVNLAKTMRDANMFDEARQVCQAALQMLPDHPEFKSVLDSLPPPKEAQN